MCAMAREPEDVDRGSNCCENEVDIEGPLQDQLIKFKASLLPHSPAPSCFTLSKSATDDRSKDGA